MQNSWLSKKVDEIQYFADRKDMKKLFDALKTIYGPQSSGTTPLLSTGGTSLLTEKEAILKRWTKHFDGVLNRPSSINDELSKDYHRWNVISAGGGGGGGGGGRGGGGNFLYMA